MHLPLHGQQIGVARQLPIARLLLEGKTEGLGTLLVVPADGRLMLLKAIPHLSARLEPDQPIETVEEIKANQGLGTFSQNPQQGLPFTQSPELGRGVVLSLLGQTQSCL